MSGKQINSYGKYSAEINGNTFTQHGNNDSDLDARIAQLKANGIDWGIDANGDIVVDADDIYDAIDRKRYGVVDAD